MTDTLSKCSKILSVRKVEKLKYAELVLLSDIDDMGFKWVAIENWLPCLKYKDKARMKSLINITNLHK